MFIHAPYDYINLGFPTTSMLMTHKFTFLSPFFATINVLQTEYNKISDWLSSNFLKLNHNKTKILLIDSPSLTEILLLHTPTLQLGFFTLPINSSVKNLGVTFDIAILF